MANILNNNFHNLKLRVNFDEYWDFFLNKDSFDSVFNGYDSAMKEECLASYIDACEDSCVAEEGKLLSVSGYSWDDAVSVGQCLNNIGLTGLDNGLIPFRRDMNTNRSFYKLYTSSSYCFDSDDYRLKLHAVSGGTNNYAYPLHVEECQIKLNGGFYQGAFETECDKYQVLPSKLENGDVWHLEFVLKKEDFEKESDKTLNSKYPNNKGIFFYIGTRAENKWAYFYNKDDEETESCYALGMDDYVDGGEISKKEYKITNLLDPNPVFVELSEIAMDDYLTYKYYSDSLYHPTAVSEDDFFGDDYLAIVEDARIIDEKNNKSTVVTWCCGLNNSSVSSYVPRINGCCSCGCYGGSSSVSTSREGYYLHKDDFFGDDYLSDIGDVEEMSDYLEQDLDISDFEFETDNGMKVTVNQYIIETDNKFLLFDRTCDGFDVHNWVDGSIARYVGRKSTFKENLFLLMNRTCTGYDVNTIEALRESSDYDKEYNVVKDIVNNALAFRITDEGAVGYRYVEYDCDSEDGYKIHEAYSKDGIIKDDEWATINVKIKCGYGKMYLYFYVNGNLVFVSDELQKLDLRVLDDELTKQEGVPYNISLGGGTQGLAETVLPNYMLDPYRTYPLEENFSGTFIGYLRSFKFYDCLMEYVEVKNNFLYEESRNA